MNKKLMALAVAGALAAPAVAFAQASSVQLYGRANLGLDSWSATGATAGSASDLRRRNRVYDSGSRLGVRGTEDLGGGLKAVFVIESGANIDAGTSTTQSGAANTSAGTLASRDSYLGLEGGWGRVSFGRQSVFWVNGANGQTGANYINNEIGWYNGASMGRIAIGIARQSNVLAYNSPTWSGFNFTVSYQPNSEPATAGANTDAKVWGVTARYYTSFIGVQYDHAENQAVSGGANRQKVSADKLSVGWPYAPGSRISGIVNRTKVDDATAVTGFATLHDDLSQSYWGLNWEHTFGNMQVFGMYSKLKEASGCTGTGCEGTNSTGVTVGLRYNFSKRTAVYTSYIKHSNGSNQTVDVTGGGYSAGTVAAGADPKIFAVGVWHSF